MLAIERSTDQVFMTPPVLIVGAGISGATLARILADAGYRVIVIDERPHVAGNCHTDLDSNTDILVHKYGPHIFHTDNDGVWDFLLRFSNFVPYHHRVLAIAKNQIYRLPINLHTLGQFFGRPFTPQEARDQLQALAGFCDNPQSFEEQALSTIGSQLYETFFHGYTVKQWGLSPTELPASILKRLPIRFTYDDNYFHHSRQAMPELGYTDMIEQMFNHTNIELRLNCRFEDFQSDGFIHTFYSGPIDRYFNFEHGRLAYRTLDFEEIRANADIQGTSVINYCDADVPHTRITEHKHLSPWRLLEGESVAYVECSRAAQADDIPYYPVRLVHDKAQLLVYQQKAVELPDVTFFGRLGTYSYLDMDMAVDQAMQLADKFIASSDYNDLSSTDT